jgi:glyoxylase-like metal-dependent hydrolase (beta-lactamase superfamily II)
MVDINEVAKNIYLIDNRLFSIPRWGCVYFIDEEKKALVESGPTNSANVVLEGIKELGFRPEDVDYIILTHIHLDHAGGAGVLVRQMPKAQVIVHHKGARHMIDPVKLVNSAIETRGQEIMVLHGEVLPVEPQRIRAVNDGDEVRLGEQQTLIFIDSPGHAPHELCIYEARNGGLFSGDAIAIYISECDILQPFHPPPQFDLEICLSTLHRLETLSARKIYYSHFGTSDLVNEHIARARNGLILWDDIVKEAAKEGHFADTKARLIDQACADIAIMKEIPSLSYLYNYLLKIHIPMCAEGHIDYYKKTMKLD